MNKNSTVIVIFLAIVALGLGYYLLANKTSQTPSNKTAQTNQKNSGSPAPVLTGDAKILTFPAANATDQEKRAHSELVRSVAKVGTSVDITGCKASPLVLSASIGATITFVNNDPKEHSLSMNQTTKYTVAPSTSTKIAPDFSQGAGIYAYTCDGGKTAAGIFVVNK